MNPRQSVEDIFHHARELGAGKQRDAYLEKACAEDPKVLRRVESLLRADEAVAVDFLDCEPGQLVSRDGERSIGPYRILDVLGRGSQATIYRAQHETLRRTVALKVLRNLSLSAGVAEQRFRREAEVTASIHHPGICGVYETGDSGGHFWIALQYVPGRTLAEHLEEHCNKHGDVVVTLSIPELAAGTGAGDEELASGNRSDVTRLILFVERVARALHVAHEHGLVHRDIKPGNVMVSEQGMPVVLDFGIAHAAESVGGGAGLTRTTDVLGTPHYMAPEQLLGDLQAVDRRTDVYALGLTLFECLTGRRPFDGPTRDALYRRILTEEPDSARHLNDKIPRDLDVVLMTAIDKQRGRRYRTALEFAEDLRRVRHSQPIAARPISTLGRMARWARRSPVVAASLLLAFLSMALGLGASLVFLQDSRAALSREQQARFQWYDSVSREVAAQDMRGEFTFLQAQQRQLMQLMIEADIPGFGDVLVRDRGEMGPTETPVIRVPVMRGQALADREQQLEGAAGVCASDWYHEQARVIMSEMMSHRRTPTNVASLLQFSELSLQHLEVIDNADLRKVRARAFLVDVLLDMRRYRRAEQLAHNYLEQERRSRARKSVHVALYRSRLGAAYLGQGRVEEAREHLLDCTEAIVRAYPETWFAFRAQANLLQLLDESAANGQEAAAAPQLRQQTRLDLCRGIAKASNYGHTSLSHWFSQCVKAALGGDGHDLWLWMSRETVLWDRRSISGDLDRVIGNLDTLIKKHGLTDGRVMALLATPFTGIGMAAGPGVDRVRALRKMIAMCDGLPEAKDSEIYLTTVVFLARDYTSRGELREAELRLNIAQGLPLAVSGSPLGAFVDGALGAYKMRCGELEQAAELLTSARDVEMRWFVPSDARAHRATADLIEVHSAAGHLQNAVVLHEARLQALDLARFRLDYARTLASFGDYAGALRQVEIADDMRQVDRAVHRLQAEILFLSGDLAGSVRCVEASIARGDETYSFVAARYLLAGGKPAEALVHFEASKLWGCLDVVGYWRDYALALAQLGREQDARVLLQDLVEQEPGTGWRRAALAQFLMRVPNPSPGDLGLAVKSAQEAHERSGQCHAEMFALVAEALHANGDDAGAIEMMAKCLECMTGDAQWLRREDARERLRRYQGR
tara:strand:- start:62140 stop:65586 length:3447 start_codon:yes stop_codon:yes gene_type:complete